MILTYKNLTEEREIYWMLKQNYFDEFEYYSGIIEKYENSRNTIKDFCISTFVSQEIIEIMNQYKNIINSNPKYTEIMDCILKNTILLLQSFHIDENNNQYKFYSQLETHERELISSQLINLCY
ncbi:hypothetical protein DSAG12_01656 [Promethearchaeum syntrophicum]|uniref:Uncharacterized protein n=1 Tax=Promethearchaeum syntrophicum TaxID=2594042 RepID=A0A5B9D9G4_9ARCH|nr:hypothetical protein [Candidatus Prometheoarchaeum syntrophicum]QEE15829.1 hypothetical protein DSAG12_01656 [Candidatus Prometheoarchaeum syntrophicum]